MAEHSGFVARAKSTWDQIAAQIRQPWAAYLIQRIFAGLPYLYEGIFDRGAPNAGAQAFQGHDHAFRGGHPISRNLVCSADIGGGVQCLYSLTTLNVHATQWYPVDEDAGTSVVVGQDWHFQGYVSPGINSQKLAVDGGNMGLEAHVFLYAQPTATENLLFRFRNVTANAAAALASNPTTIYSDEKTAVLTNGVDIWYDLHFESIPCIPDTWNRWILEYSNPVGASGKIDVAFVVISETRERSEPAIKGTTPILSIPGDPAPDLPRPLVLSAWDRQAGPLWGNQGTGATGDYDPAGAGGGTDPAEILGLPGYEFDGNDDRLNDGKSPFADDEAFTMGAWVKLDDVDCFPDGGPFAIICVGIEGGGSTAAILYVGFVQDGDVCCEFGEGEGFFSDDADLVSVGDWFHIAVTKAAGDTTSGKVYVNGVEKSCNNTGNTPAVTNDSLTYGAYRNGGGYQYFANGQIAGVFIDPSEYSDVDIADIFHRQKAMFGL